MSTPEEKPDSDHQSDADSTASAGDKAGQGTTPSQQRPGTSSSTWQPPSRRAGRGKSGGSDADTAATTDDRAPEIVPPTPLTQQIGRAVVVLLAIVFGVFAVVNSQYVDFSWIFGKTAVDTAASGERIAGGVPLIVLLVSSALIGGLVGSVITWQAGRSRRRKRGSDSD